MERGLLGAFVLLTCTVAAPRGAEAQIYTRIKDGVVEATNVPQNRSYRLTYPGKGTLIHSAGFRLRPSSNAIFNAHIEHAAATSGVAIDLVRAVIQAESQFDHLAVSTAGAQGLMQLMPDTARRFGVSNSFDPEQNIRGGVRYLRVLLDMFGGDVDLALAGYNAGENAVLKYNGIPPYKETQGYVRKIRAILEGGGMAPPVRMARASLTPGAGGKVPAALFIAPASGTRAGTTVALPSVTPRVVKPRVYYRWKDSAGVLHVAHTPPPEGVVYSMIRSVE